MIALALPVGMRFGYLSVTDAIPVKRPGKRKAYRRCLCDCGAESLVETSKLVSGHTKSCGCIKRTHGQSADNRTPEYVLWIGMKQRCYDPNYHHFHDYGGRGITVCDQWLNSFEAFVSYVGKRPTPGHSLDRYPNTNGNYEPGNVRWATRSQQQRNKRNSRFVTINGESLPAADWANRNGIALSVMNGRFRAGWLPELAVTMPTRPIQKVACLIGAMESSEPIAWMDQEGKCEPTA